MFKYLAPLEVKWNRNINFVNECSVNLIPPHDEVGLSSIWDANSKDSCWKRVLYDRLWVRFQRALHGHLILRVWKNGSPRGPLPLAQLDTLPPWALHKREAYYIHIVVYILACFLKELQRVKFSSPFKYYYNSQLTDLASQLAPKIPDWKDVQNDSFRNNGNAKQRIVLGQIILAHRQRHVCKDPANCLVWFNCTSRLFNRPSVKGVRTSVNTFPPFQY